MESKTKKTTEKKPAKEEKHSEKKSESKGTIAVIRIIGMVKVKPDTAETLYRLGLRRKYSCILINPSNISLMGMLNKVKYSVAYGEVDKDILGKLIKSRAEKIDGGKFDSEKITEEILSGKNLKDFGLKSFFRLHPPRKGIKSKLQYPKGVLGNHGKDINKLIERML
jgi:large subunit ribosomal protein L30